MTTQNIPDTAGDAIPDEMVTIQPPTVTGSEILIRTLEYEGVEVIFGHPGGAIITLYDELSRIQPSFKHILVRHEQGGTHAAEGYAKATGKVGVMLATSGPGATNTVTGIADAYMDSVPIVVITGQVPTHLIGNDAFQEADIVGITRTITKHNYLVRDVRDLSRVVREAFHIAQSGRPGPVLVDIPKDVLLAKAPLQIPESIDIRGYHVPMQPSKAKVQQAADMIMAASKPLLYVGGGCLFSGAAEELAELARKTQIPVTTTLHGIGAFPVTDELSLHMLGMHGTWYANQAVQHADLLIAVGARFDDRVTGKLESWAPHAKIIHMDIDPSCISKNVYVDCAVVGDVKRVLQQLLPLVGKKDTSAWLEQIAQWKQECPLGYDKDGQLRPQYILDLLWEKTQGDAVVITDVGQNQMWGAQFFKYVYPRTHITSGGLGTMGFSLPAAMGASFGQQTRPVVSINGDGGFLMNAQELGVISQYNLPVKIIIFNNNFLGMVRQWQELFHESRYSHTDLSGSNPDYVKLAEAFRIKGLYCENVADVQKTLDEAFAHDGPVLMEFKVVKEEMVFPMVPSGASTDEMITKRMTPDSFV
ncbi:MAG: biosynthetic-type acetolactate synthase large subunit [Bacteroidetes Order II. Incertae sedis bacterium]|nr:biosynthetic-type acetolactate synthase large subunit [Bacteroidetes Order II. bacterium]